MTSLASEPLALGRLLAGGWVPDHRTHLGVHGPLPRLRAADPQLLEQIAASGLTGRGGAAFPTATKLRSVAHRRRTTLIANGTESEPASEKDAVLLTHSPHLVLDGMLVATALIGARESTIAVSRDGETEEAIAAAIAERPAREPRPRVSALPHRFVTGEETALVSAAGGGAPLPTGRRPFEDGTLVLNVETLAHLALIARHGGAWFRRAGTPAEPGTALATVSGAVAAPGVVEFELGTSLGEVWEEAGGLLEPVDAVLVGGYFGRWLPADPATELSAEGLRARGGLLGARAIVALGRSSCGLTETARVVRWLAGESAGQCGPCIFGLSGLADALDDLVAGRETTAALRRVEQLHAQVAGRGACHHPDGTLGFAASALEAFGVEVERHRRGRCSATSTLPVLPTPEVR